MSHERINKKRVKEARIGVQTEGNTEKGEQQVLNDEGWGTWFSTSSRTKDLSST